MCGGRVYPVPVRDDDVEIEDKEFLEKIAKEIVERSMTAPAVLFLEMAKPFNRIGHQFMIFIEPIIQSFLTIKEYQKVRDLLEDRENIEYLIRTIEDMENSRKGTGNKKA